MLADIDGLAITLGVTVALADADAAAVAVSLGDGDAVDAKLGDTEPLGVSEGDREGEGDALTEGATDTEAVLEGEPVGVRCTLAEGVGLPLERGVAELDGEALPAREGVAVGDARGEKEPLAVTLGLGDVVPDGVAVTRVVTVGLPPDEREGEPVGEAVREEMGDAVLPALPVPAPEPVSGGLPLAHGEAEAVPSPERVAAALPEGVGQPLAVALAEGGLVGEAAGEREGLPEGLPSGALAVLCADSVALAVG